MPNKIQFYFFLLIAMGSIGCIEPLEWEDDDVITGRLVIEGRITSETGPHYIYLSRTREVITEGAPAGVSGAEVIIDDGTHAHHLKEVRQGQYATDSTFIGQVGSTYTLQITLDGKTYESIAHMPKVEPLPPIEMIPWEGMTDAADQRFQFTYRSNFGQPRPYHYSIALHVPEDPSKYYPEGWERPHWIDSVLASDDKLLRDSAYYLHPGLEPPALFAYGESTYAGYTYGTVVTEKFYSMTDEHYDFVRAVLSETDWQGLGPFGYVPANVPTNISNGALGWFSASDVAILEQTVLE